jgi:hypothetical protein
MDDALGEACSGLSDVPQQPGPHERGPHQAPNWYAQRAVPGRSHPVTAVAERRVLRRDRRRWRRILALSERMTWGAVSDALRGDWLALEEALHAHWMAIAIEHYNLGVEAGRKAALREHACDDGGRARPRDPLERARALVAAIAEALEEV